MLRRLKENEALKAFRQNYLAQKTGGSTHGKNAKKSFVRQRDKLAKFVRDQRSVFANEDLRSLPPELRNSRIFSAVSAGKDAGSEANMYESSITTGFKRLLEKEHIKGGKADRMRDSNFRREQLTMGKKVEREHTKNPKVAKEIAKDHLKEFPDYYTRLKKMEHEAKEKEPVSKESMRTTDCAFQLLEKVGGYERELGLSRMIRKHFGNTTHDALERDNFGGTFRKVGRALMKRVGEDPLTRPTLWRRLSGIR